MNPQRYDTEQLNQILVNMLAKALRIEPERVDRDRPFTHYGLDSIAALMVSGDLEEALSIELPSTLLWDCPTINALAARLGEMLHASESASVA